MKKVLIGAAVGALGVLGYRKIYNAAFSKGIDTGVGICMDVLNMYVKEKKGITVEEEKTEES